MKASDRIALIYGVSVLGAGAVSYWRGRQSTEVLYDALLHGAVVGTGVNAVAWMMAEQGYIATANPHHGTGTLSQKALDVLATVNPDVLDNYRGHGVKIAPLPENPSIINQEQD